MEGCLVYDDALVVCIRNGGLVWRNGEAGGPQLVWLGLGRSDVRLGYLNHSSGGEPCHVSTDVPCGGGRPSLKIAGLHPVCGAGAWLVADDRLASPSAFNFRKNESVVHDWAANLRLGDPIDVVIRNPEGQYLARGDREWAFTNERQRAIVFDFQRDHVAEYLQMIRKAHGPALEA